MTPADDIEILFPERAVKFGGARVIVYEFSFIDGMQLAAEMPELIQSMHTHLGERRDADLDRDVVLAVFDAFPQAVDRWLACATRRAEDWVRALNADARELLLLTAWAVNQDFFFQHPAIAGMPTLPPGMALPRSLRR